MNQMTAKFQNKRGESIFYRSWEGKPPSCSWIAIFVHGQGEHSGRYQSVANALIEEGAIVYALDHVGHGQSDGKRGCITQFSDYIEDLDVLVENIKTKHPELPIVLVGHSLGGLIAADYSVSYPDKITLVVLSSPFFKLKMEIPKIKRIIGNLFANVLPNITLSNEINPKDLSTDPQNADQYSNDPLVHDQVSARWSKETIDRMHYMHANTNLFKNPILIMHGKEDQVLDPDGSRQIYENIMANDKELKIWDGMCHEIFNEMDKTKVYNFMLEWIKQRL